MEIVPMNVPADSRAVGLPFNRRNVEEWSRLDSITGMMEKAKIETDRWSASNSVGAHNFAKVVDSRERNLPDGSLQQKQRKQLEIFQTMVPGGSMQVIRSQTVTTSSSTSSQWTSGKAFGELQLPVNHLDLSSQKTKGSVGRSGSISGRRPPSRPRSLIADHTGSLAARLHEQTRARIFGTFSNGFDHHEDEEVLPSSVVITEVDSEPPKTNLSRQKSCSNENINDDEENSFMKRSSRFRRSLQIPKTTPADDIPDWTNGKSLKERAAEIENLLRCGNSVSYEVKEPAEEEVFQSPAKVKSSFVTAETLKEVRDRLRKSSCEDDVPETVRVKDFVSDMEAKLSKRTSEWYQRRKTYGFEKMESNGESSTDSGCCQLENPSPFQRTGGSRDTSSLKQFVDEPAWTRKSPLPIRERSSLRLNKNPWISQLRGTKLVDREWFNNTPDPDSGVPDSPKAKDEDKPFDFDSMAKKQKKVEFCKTEVHFAAEPGRFHIVETDGKPPSSAVLRRTRRRPGRDSPTPVSNLPELKFGDSLLEKKMLSTNAEKIDTLSKKIESELNELSKIVVEALPTKPVSEPVQNLPKLYNVEEEQDESSKPRGILKPPVWKSTVVLQNKRFDDVRNERKCYSSDGESELLIRFRNLKKVDDLKPEPVSVEIKRRSLPDDVLLNGHRTTVDINGDELPVLSVAERIKQVEELKSRNYSSKIDFRMGEMTVLQNGTVNGLKKKEFFTWPESNRRESLDMKTVSNPLVKRFPTKDSPNTAPTTTTRISINIPCENKTQANKNKPYRSWSFAGGSTQCEKPQSASLVMQTIQDSEVLKTVKPVHEMINKFDSLSRPAKKKDQRRKTMPINYKAPKVYTHADLEEELRNFTEDLDKDFRDIYEEEIGSCRDIKKMFELCAADVSCELKARTLPLANGVRKRLTKQPQPPRQISLNNGHKSNDCDSDDSDLLADEEVRSYMSTGQGGSDSDDLETMSGSRKKSFDRIRLQFKRLEQRNHARRKEAKTQTASIPIKPTFVEVAEPHYVAPPKVASISLRYEDDPIFKTKDLTDLWEKTSNSSSTMSDNRPRERASYLNGPSLSEKFSKRGSNSSLDSLFERTAKVQDTTRSSFRSNASSSFKEVAKKPESEPFSLEELTRAADDMLVSVNGMNDHLSSSDDEERSRKIIKGKITNLGTISEGRKVQSVEKASPEAHRKIKEKTSRATRLLQRATSREASLAQRSSSEDIPTNIEPVKKKLVRRPRPTHVKTQKELPEKSSPRTRIRPKDTEEAIPRERVKTVSSAAKEVTSVRSSSRTCSLVNDRTERTKPSQRRELLSKADALAEQSVRSKRNSSTGDPNQQSLSKRRTAKVSLRKVEAARVSQAV